MEYLPLGLMGIIAVCGAILAGVNIIRGVTAVWRYIRK